MRLINVQTFQLEEFLDYKAPPYAILSHTWGDDAEELTFDDVKMGRIDKAGVGSIKFHGSCRQAAKDGFGYVWIDTCCIDKTNLVELSEAINSMFRWYRCASVCYAYLSDVPGDDHARKLTSNFSTSRWFVRGWTLQELLAPKQLRFYHKGWGYLGTKGTMRTVVGKITGIPHQILLGITELQSMSVAQRMSWAARRETKRKEDLAYCLLGIFNVTMPMIYGEGADQAFLRLQEQIMRTTRDDSILAWGLCPPEETPIDDPDQVDPVGRILATGPSDFANSGHIICRKQPRSLDISGGSLRLYVSLLTSASRAVGLLDCGPKHDPQQAVGIPLVQAASGLSDEYVRPKGRHTVLQSIAAASTSPRLIHIRNDSQHKSAKAKEQYWLYDEDAFAEVNLDLVNVNPPSYWDQERAMIVSTMTASDSVAQQILARFRHREEECPDFVILLGFRQHDTSTEPQCHVMICGRGTSLQELDEKLHYVVQKAHGKESASNGLIHLRIVLEPDQQQSIFTIKLEALPSPPDVTIDITAELEGPKAIIQLPHDATTKWRLRQTLKSHSSWVLSVAFSPDSTVLASGSDTTVQLWDVATGQLQQTLEGHSSRVCLVAFSPDSTVLASGSGDATVRLWDVVTGQLRQTLKGHDSRVCLVAFSPDSTVLASGSGDATVQLWDIVTGQLRQTLKGHSSWVCSVAFSPDLTVLASGSGDATVRLWDIVTGQLRQILKGHSSWVCSVAFSPDSTVLASGSADGTVRLWEVATDGEV